MKKLLLLALIIRAFSADTAHALDWANVKSILDSAAPTMTILGVFSTMYYSYKTNIQSQETHGMNKENHGLDKTTKIEGHNSAYLSQLKEMHMTLTEAAKRKKSDKKLDLELKANEKALCNFRAFTSLGKFDKETYNPETTYVAKDLEKIKTDEEKSTSTKKSDTSKQPGFFRKTANAIMIPVTLAQTAANKVADILPVNALLSRIAEHESLKGTFFDTHKRDIGGVLVTATIAALSYKTYSWYYNEARITASETIIELEEQAKLIAAQYKQEMKRTDLSAEDKAKLKKACMQYMKQLKENIQQQKIIAGHNVYRNLFVGAVIAAVGLPVLIKYYPDELKKMFLPTAPPQETESKTDDTTVVTPVVIPVATQPNGDSNAVVPSGDQTSPQNTDNQPAPETENTPAETTTTELSNGGWDLFYQDLERLKQYEAVQKTIAWWYRHHESTKETPASSENNNNNNSQTAQT